MNPVSNIGFSLSALADSSCSGFVYTRLFRRAQEAFKTLKDHAREAQVLDALLGQRYWRRRKRGAWYDRRALLQTKYLCWVDGMKHEDVLYEAMAGVYEALNDEDTGLGT